MWLAVRSYLLVAMLAGLCITSQISYTKAHIGRIQRSDVSIPINELIEPSVLPPTTLIDFSFGMRNVIADALWLITIQYYGGGDPYAKYRKLPELMTAITSLDPRFSYPYSFAGLVMPNEGFSSEALTILQSGEQHLPNDWQLPYYEGTIYFINLKDSRRAAEAYARASSKPGAQPITQFLSAIQFDKSNDEKTARAIFEQLAQASTNDYFKQRAAAFVAHYQLLDDFRTVINDFHAREGRYPTSLQELVDKKYIAQVPQDPLNRLLQYNPQTGIVSADPKQ